MEHEEDERDGVEHYFLWFFPEGYVAALIALCSPVVAGRLIFGGFPAEGAIILGATFALTVGAVFAITKRAKFLAWLCMVVLITTVFLVNEHLPSPHKIVGKVGLSLLFTASNHAFEFGRYRLSSQWVFA